VFDTLQPTAMQVLASQKTVR